MAQLLDCKLVAQSIKDDCKAQADALKAQGITPKLGIVRVGEKGPDLAYERGATNTMNEAGIEVEVFAMPADVSQDDYIKKFREINADPSIHGILAFRPLDNIDETEAISNNLSAVKDCDSSTTENMGKVVINDPTGLYPCTAAAIMEIIDFYADVIKAHVAKKYKVPERGCMLRPRRLHHQQLKRHRQAPLNDAHKPFCDSNHHPSSHTCRD